ncbi:MAG TPA: phosphotransferase [Pseudonocardiaceae bacterium]|nr:phosphotransferase [Pseudonocardiaceae bacterium]
MSDDRLTTLVAACKQAGLNAAGATLLRYHVNAVYHLPRPGAVARMSPFKRQDQAHRGVEVTRWLRAAGFPATVPLDVDQPVQVDDCVVTFWRYYDAHGRSLPPPTELAGLLRQLHGLASPPYPLPPYQPLASFLDELKTYGPKVLAVAEYDFLCERAEDLTRAYTGLTSALGSGLIHGDARVGNMMWDGDAVVLGDWDSVSIGPRELDLVITYQGTRYGRSEADLDEFARVYGWDIREWPGYATLRDIRDLQTLGAPLRLAVDRSEVANELHHRMRGLRAGDYSQRWHSF